MIEGPHTWIMPTISQDHNKMDLKLVGKNIVAMVEENEQLTIPTFIEFVRQEFGYTIIVIIHTILIQQTMSTVLISLFL